MEEAAQWYFGLTTIIVEYDSQPELEDRRELAAKGSSEMLIMRIQNLRAASDEQKIGARIAWERDSTTDGV